MKALKRIFIVIEVIVAFSVPFLSWVLALIFSPALIAGILYDEGGIYAFFLLLIVIFGGVGLWGMLQLTAKVLEPTFYAAKPKVLRIYLVLGVFALITAAALLSPAFIGLAFIPALLVCLHFSYLARGYLLLKD